MIQPGTVWKDTETGEIVMVESCDGAYAVVFGEHPGVGRGISFEGKPNAFLVQRDHFGKLYVPEEK